MKKTLIGLAIAILIVTVSAVVAVVTMGRHADGLASITASVSIDRPPAAVFPWLTDSRKLKQWVEGLDEVSFLSEGGFRSGARVLHVYSTPARRSAIRWEMTEVDAPSRLRLTGTTSAFDETGTWTLRESAGKTLLAYEASIRYKPLLSRLLAGRTARGVEAKLRRDLVHLKRVIEMETAPPVTPI